MRVAFVCNDTRGGIQPYVALALGLRGAGHEVRAVAPSDTAGLFAAEGIPVAPLAGSIEAVLRGSGGVPERGILAAVRFAARELPARLEGWTRRTLEACEGVDLLTGGIGGMVVGLSVAERLGVPFVETHLQPVGAPTDAYPGGLFPGTPRWLGGWALRLGHRLTEAVLWRPFRAPMASVRARVLGLTGAPRVQASPVLYGFSRRVVQPPAGGARARHATGYWFLPAPASWSPPPGLEGFLARGGPVVSIGFGSMPSRDPAATAALVIGAVRDAGVRAVLLSGWGGLGPVQGAGDLYAADAVPHDWLFPRVTAAVHHAGAGTTGAAVRAGIPSVAVPFTMDQPFWASRIAALGVGPPAIPRAALARKRLSEALRRATGDGAMRARAEALGALVRAEDGVAEAVGSFERLGRRHFHSEQNQQRRSAP